MFKKLRSLRRSTKVLIIAVFLLSSFVVYAAVTGLLTDTITSQLEKGNLFEMELRQDAVTGEVTPGSTVAVSPVVVNQGTKDALAYIKITVPEIPFRGHPARRRMNMK